MATAAQNKKNIKKNRRTIFEVEGKVTANKSKAYASRSIIEENRALILKNYTAAFMGNRQLANQNTDDIFRNRQAILSSMETSSDVEENFVASMINEANLDFLEHRDALNAADLSANDKKIAVLHALRYILGSFDYPDKKLPKPKVWTENINDYSLTINKVPFNNLSYQQYKVLKVMADEE